MHLSRNLVKRKYIQQQHFFKWTFVLIVSFIFNLPFPIDRFLLEYCRFKKGRDIRTFQAEKKMAREKQSSLRQIFTKKELNL